MKRLFGRVAVAEEVDNELKFHFEMTVRELIASGLAPDQARAEAARRFGNVESVTMQCERFGRERDAHENRAEFRTEFAQDLSFAARQLARARSFSAVAILTLALGIGATAAVFSALYSVVLRPLPFDNPDRVVLVRSTLKGKSQGLSAAEFLELHDHASGLEKVTAMLGQYGFTLTDGETPELVGGGRVTSDFFSVFGVHPIVGRTFDGNEDAAGRDHVVVLSHRFWMSHYAGNNGAVGQSIHLNLELYTIIGVMPASFDIETEGNDLWTPLTISQEDVKKSGAHYLLAYARLRAGVTTTQAAEQATTILRQLAAQLPVAGSNVNDLSARVVNYSDQLVGDYRSLLFTLLGAVSFVLLIACTNIANLLLSRGTSRAKELAIRVALGAGRGRLLRQMLTESLMLSIIGAGVGLIFAFAILRGVRAISPSGIPRLDMATLDWPVLAFTLLLAVVCSMVFGLVPALRASGTSLQSTLRASGRSSSGGRTRDPLRNVLVGAEVALAMTLLTGAGLLIRSAWLVQHVDPGFDTSGVLTARLILPATQYADGASIAQAYARIRDEATRIPGVRFAALSSVVPLSGGSTISPVRVEGAPSSDAPHPANLRLVSPDYFAAMNIRIRAGRDISLRDDASAPLVAIINETMAHELWPGQSLNSAIGKRLDAISKRGAVDYREVIGVVSDLHDAGLSKAVTAEFYLPIPQTPELFWSFIQRSLVVVVKSANATTDAMTLKKPLQEAVARVDRALPLADAKTMYSFVQTSMENARFNTILLSALGAIALALASVGVYGVVSFFVTQRTQEIGIRMALGASPKQIWREVVRRGLAPIVVGIVAGFVLSMFTASVLRSQLYGIGTTDPSTYGVVAVLLLLVSLVATYVPARRAMRVSPNVALNAG